MSETLHFTAAAHCLAASMYYARIQAFQLDDVRMWENLSSDTKKAWIVRAAEFLKTLQPAPPKETVEQHRARSPYFDLAVSITKDYAKVIGAIAPEAPWGESR